MPTPFGRSTMHHLSGRAAGWKVGYLACGEFLRSRAVGRGGATDVAGALACGAGCWLTSR
jgi:hypothetical protein